MPRNRRLLTRLLAAAITALSIAALAAPVLSAQSSGGRWIGSWSTALVGRPRTPPMPGPPGPPPFRPSDCPAPAAAAPPAVPPPGVTFAPQPYMHFTNQTLRQVVRATAGGPRLRIMVSNAWGSAPLTIGAAHVALREKAGTIKPGGQAMAFSGRPTITIPANAVAYSDPIALQVAPLADLAIDLYLPGTTDADTRVTMHNAAYVTNYVSETGNHAGAASFPVVATPRSWFLVSRVEVESTGGAGVIVAFGDSITDGTASTPETNSRWPDVLARRLQSAGSAPTSVLNAGIGGNRVLTEGAFGAGINALARFEADVLSQTGVTHVIVLEGINDIGNARQNPMPTAEDLIAGHRQLVERAHARGVKIIGGTLTPFWGAAYYTEAGEAKRQALNAWIRTGGAYDGVIDFDKATRDPADPKKLLAAYDSCDHLHPSDAGYKGMGEAIDLSLFAWKR